MNGFATKKLKPGETGWIGFDSADQPLNIWFYAPSSQRFDFVVTNREGAKRWANYEEKKKGYSHWAEYLDYSCAGNIIKHIGINPDEPEIYLVFRNRSKNVINIEYCLQSETVRYSRSRFAPSLGGGILGWFVGGPIGAAVGSLICGSNVRDD